MNSRIKRKSTTLLAFMTSIVLLGSALLVSAATGATRTTLQSKTNGDLNTLITRVNAVLT